MCGAVNLKSDDACTDCGEILSRKSVTTDEYQSIKVGQVLDRSWQLFWEYPGLCLLGPLLANILFACFAGLLLGGFILFCMGLDSVMPEGPLMVLSVAFLGLILVIVTLYGAAYCELGKVLLFLKVARDHQPVMGDLFAGRPFIGRMVLCTILFQGLIFFANLIFALLGYVLALMFWPYPYLLVDRNLPGVDAFGKSVDVTKGNLLTLFLIFLSLFGLVLLGVAALFGISFLLVYSLELPFEAVLGGAILLSLPATVFFYSYVLLVKAVAYAQITHSP
ncbi:hypothetical protein HG66A1_12140 [Gimesia chilikensis]|uniref:Glycerophosphoryl diester phosphodiesterase membrane domain-containing protein n=2 Tax=Gimesia chilikensis TaxID=2605989 RepID=A0A517PJ95_9PLAN|nr:hypothetical protein HG66A1_12140 [Gimesia chilikensis]